MANLRTTCIAVLLLGLAIEFSSCQKQIMAGFRSGRFGKMPPVNRPNAIDPKAMAEAREKLSAKSFNFAHNPCNLKRLEPYRDPAIKGTSTPGRSSNGIPGAIMSMALRRAVQRGGSDEVRAAKALMDSARQIKASQMKAMSAARNRTKRQITNDMTYMSDTIVTQMCAAEEKLITSVVIEGTKCYTIQPQEVKMWECASPFVRGMSNAFPFMQKFYCEPSNYVDTAWYVVCPFREPTVRIHAALVPINCGCSTYKCNFEPYQSDVALDF